LPFKQRVAGSSPARLTTNLEHSAPPRAFTATPYRVTIVVLGDLGRSPRMLNHALALAGEGAEVCLAGYRGSAIEGAIASHPKIRIAELRPPRRAPEGSSSLRFLLQSALEFGILHLRLLRLLLFRTPRPDALLVQNPPSIPTLSIGLICARLRGARFLVDWHNFGYAMLALRVGGKHPAVAVARRFERLFGRRADGHFCVSGAMRKELAAGFGIPGAAILYDRPEVLEPPLTAAQKRLLASEVLSKAGIPYPEGSCLLVCPTSWTADEDASLLIDALGRWDSNPDSGDRPHLLVLFTGRGPLRSAFEQQLRGLRWRGVDVRTAFLEPGEYRKLLRAANLGISLHRSASGVDLPMKVMDFFGARTPVCAFDYGPCLAEQIEAGRTGVTFRSGEELARALRELCGGFPRDTALLDALLRNIAAACNEDWRSLWRREAAPLFSARTTRTP
jgi:beta-1,4-mannosyltransferase